MTMSRRLSVGTRHCLTYSTKVGPFIGPSRTNGATIRSWRRPATKVMVFQCPYGAYPTSRMPRAQRPRSRTILVLVAVSSIKTSRAGSSKPCSRIQRRRARATSARCCSAAYRLFFEADIVAKKEATDGAAATGNTGGILGHNHLIQRQIRLCCNQLQKPFRIVFQPRHAAAAPATEPHEARPRTARRPPSPRGRRHRPEHPPPAQDPQALCPARAALVARARHRALRRRPAALAAPLAGVYGALQCKTSEVSQPQGVEGSKAVLSY